MTAQENILKTGKRCKENWLRQCKSRGYKNVHEIPKLKHITINMGLVEAAIDKNIWKRRLKDDPDRRTKTYCDLGAEVKCIVQNPPKECQSGQSDFARQRMYEFLDRLVTIALPRVRDFPWN